jgi:uncharacterized membrane protein
MRTAKKTATYSVMHLTVAFLVAFALTRDWRAALAIGLIEPIFQTIAFALHERAWAKAEAKGQTARSPRRPEPAPQESWRAA